ncbi:MAG: mucoidy inhibitor MuiA family protein [Planctomycetota bacterium]
MRHGKAVWWVACALAMAGAVAAGEVTVTGTIESVTLYRGQAMVMRSIPVEEGEGLVELVVTDLPENVVAGSIYASAEGDTQVRAVRYGTRAVGQVPRAEVQQLKTDQEAVEAELRKLQSDRALLTRQDAYLTKLHDFVAPTAKVEMTRGVLNADELQKLTTFMFDQKRALQERLFELSETERKAKERLDLLQRRLAELTRGSSKTVREALVFLEKPAGATTLRLHYLVSNADWSPVYNLYAANGQDTVRVEYSALVQQMSGEDWEGVELTLSTASAVLVADAVNLAPLWVNLVPQGGKKTGLAELERTFRSAQHQIAKYNKNRDQVFDFEGQISAQWDLNRAANMVNNAELVSGGDQMRRVQKLVQKRTSGLSANYKIDGRVSVASRSDQQMVRIAELALPASFYNVATPLLTEYVYRQADLMNSSDTALLEGTSSVYLDGEFVGKGSVPMTARGQKLVVGLGIDPQLRAWREFISKNESVQGGNKVIRFRYRLVLDNYKDEPAAVRVFDRVPYGDASIKVTLDEDTEKALSDDKEYLRAFRPNGILRWDVEVPAKSAAESAHIVEYGFTLEFDRKLDVSATPAGAAEQKAKQQFEMDMRMRR